MLTALALLAAGTLMTPGPRPRPVDATVTVTVDSARHEIHVKAGPFFLPNMGAIDHHMMDMGASHDTPVFHFDWPVQGWLRGFKTGVVDADDHDLPKRVMHHMIVVNYSRRQALYPAAERLFGAGQETADAMLPATIGVPMTPGMDLGFYIAWHNDTGQDMDGVYMTMTLIYTPPNQNPRPVDVLPYYMDVNLTVGGSNTFDVPPGRSEKSWVFTQPIDGRLLGYGGHLHDYGVQVRLEDVKSGKVIAEVHADHDKNGKVSGVSRSLPGVRGAGLRLRAGVQYRVVGVYDNPTGETIKNGAMAHMSGIFAPSNPRQWPSIDESDPTYQRDLASLEMLGADQGDGHDHDHNAGDHDHDMKDMKDMHHEGTPQHRR